ncbi:MAG: LPS-assembly protein LptD [Tannerella sp.]|nr:LPS-assembly protein LptD [Tannerella sp.]
MKKIVLLTLLVVSAGCSILQHKGGNAGRHPEPLQETVRDEVVQASANSANSGADSLATDSILNNFALDLRSDSLHKDSLIAVSDSVVPDSIAPAVIDSAIMAENMSIHRNDTLMTDTMKRKKGGIEATVDYQAKDSIVWTAGNMAYLFGDGDVKYQNIELKSEIIQMNMDSSTIYAAYGVDSLGEEFGFPVFTEGEQNIEAKQMRYNFKTEKATARNVVTQQGEGYVTAELTKKLPNDVMNMQDGKYTTCDEHEHPHFYINMTKAKVRPGKDIVTGPAYLVVEDVPLFPLVLPFAFFPFTDTYSSGILMPSYGDEMSRGFYLRNGGYYFALSDYFDLALTGEVYTKGSWGISGQTSYRKRYKYSGNFDMSYLTTITGDKGMPDYSKSNDFKVRWSHSQDAKANPFRTFSASVDYSTSSYDRKQLNSLYTSAATQNNKGSSINMTQRFPNKPFSISATMNINQRSQDSTVSVTLPDLTLTLSRIYPLKRKNAIGKERWYEKISMSYTGYLRNNISTKEDKLFKSSLVRDWKNGMQHTIPVSATYSLFDAINISPSFNYVERWYTNKVNQAYDPERRQLAVVDTTYGFYRIYNYSASVSASTTLYGTFVPIKPLRKLFTKVRHRFDPSLSYSMTPDFGDPKYGFYQNYMYVNGLSGDIGAMPDTIKGYYSPFSGQLFGVPGRGKSGSVSLSLDNNIEAKIPDEEEPSGERKISIIDKLSLSTSYNLAADSFQFSDLSSSIRLKLSKSYTLNLSMMFDTYMYDYNETTGQVRRVNKTRYQFAKGFGKIGRLRSTGTQFSYTLSNDTFKKLFGGDGESKSRKKNNRNDDEDYDEDELDDPNNPMNPDNDLRQAGENRKSPLNSKKKKTDGEYDEDGYYNATVPWSLSFSYSLSLSYGAFNPKILEYDYKLVNSLSFNGNIQPTKNWRVTFNATYDFDNKKISYMTCNISRTMHCFQMSASIIPIGPLKSYSFTISANSSMLKDLKYDQSSTPYNGQSWY